MRRLGAWYVYIKRQRWSMGIAVSLAMPLGAAGAYLMASWMLEMLNVISTDVLQVSPWLV